MEIIKIKCAESHCSICSGQFYHAYRHKDKVNLGTYRLLQLARRHSETRLPSYSHQSSALLP